jgi:hypothetical protein
LLADEMNFGNCPILVTGANEKNDSSMFPNGKQTLKFDEFIGIIKDSCNDRE